MHHNIFNTQGSTFVQNVVIDIGKADKASGLTYVALSRATLDDQIYHCGYPEDRIEKHFKAAGFIARVIEEQRCVRFHYVSVVYFVMLCVTGCMNYTPVTLRAESYACLFILLFLFVNTHCHHDLGR